MKIVRLETPAKFPPVAVDTNRAAAKAKTEPEVEAKVESKVETNMSGHILFAFGPHNAFYFYCLGESILDNCSWNFRHFLRSTKIPVYVALGPGDEEYCALYEDDRPAQMYQFNRFSDSSHLQFLADSTRRMFKVEKVHFSAAGFAFGPNRTFVVTTPYSVISSEQLPASLTSALGSRKRKSKTAEGIEHTQSYYPNQISLGSDDAWFVRWADGACAWDFGQTKAYTGLKELLGRASSEGYTADTTPSIDYLVLNQWHDQHWFCVMDHGRRIEFALSKRTSEQIFPLIQKYLEGTETVTTTDAIHAVMARSDDNSSLPPAYENTGGERRDGWLTRLFRRSRAEGHESTTKTKASM